MSQQAAVCINAQAGDFTDIGALIEDQGANVDRTASGSKFRKAEAAAWKAFETAVDYMENAYRSVVAGNISAANNWITRSDAQIKENNKQVKIVKAELKAINKLTDETNGAREALDRRVAATASICSFSP